MKKIIALFLFLSLAFTSPIKRTFQNGLTLIVAPREVSQLVSISTIIKGGSIVEKTPGASSLLIRLIPLGTKNHTKDEIEKILEENLIDLQTEINENYWSISITCPAFSLKEALKLLGEIIFQPLLDEYDFESEKRKAISEIEEISSRPFTSAYARLRESLYGRNHPYARLINGTKESLQSLSLEELRHLLLSYFQPQNVFVAIAGDVETEETIEIAKDLLGSFPKGEIIRLTYPFFYPLVRSEVDVMERASPFAYLFVGIPLPGMNYKDYPVFEIINTLLGKGTSSRLAKALRWRMGISYDFGSLYPPLLGKSHLLVWAAVDPQRVEEAKEAILNEITSLDDIDQNELEKAKNKLIGDFILSQAQLKNFSFSLAWFEAMGLGYDYIDKFPKLVKTVNIWDVKKIVRRYLKGNVSLLLLIPSS
ncbi:insulinase family protein [bacterium]|nr:insulinase family protein [bacterium]